MHSNRLIIFLCALLFCLATMPAFDVIGQDTTSEKTPTNNKTENTGTLPLFNIAQLNFEGNKHFNQKKLRDLFRWEVKKVYSQQEIVAGFERILSAYRKEGFVFALVSQPTVSPISASNTQVSINVTIREGKRLRIGDFSLIGNELFSQSKILRELGLRKGQFFTQTALEQGIERIQLLYSEHGHPKVEIEPIITNLLPAIGNINFALQIREGEKVKINEIKVSGLQKTKTDVVLREISVKANDFFDQRKIDQSYHRLRNLGYFYHIQPNLLEAGTTEDTINFHAKVTEARTGRLILVLGYAPPVEDSDSVPQLTGVVEARETNLLGTGRDVNIYWKSGLLKALRLGYKEPWVLGKPITLGVMYSQLKQRSPINDSESEERAASISGNTKFGRFYESEVTLGYKQLMFEDYIPTFLPSNIRDPSHAPMPTVVDRIPAAQLGRGSKYSVTLRLTRDSRDYFLNPTQGRRDSVAVELSRSDFKLRKVWLDLQQYFQTWENQIIAIELHGAAAWGINIPPTELFYLGGATTLRGYDEDWFSGPRRAHANLEYRFLTGRNSQIFTFVDLGSVTFIDRPSVFDKLRIGYGFGARLESKGGIIQLDYGLAAGDSALRGKIHVKLGAAF
ncbi:MAG: BamA/TamA family outer membrane protein [Candidatus Poribacteria bacterium]|nr:BamA/TamA family outer membrane protein [Candidatus Poribacteria bacterium]